MLPFDLRVGVFGTKTTLVPNRDRFGNPLLCEQVVQLVSRIDPLAYLTLAGAPVQASPPSTVLSTLAPFQLTLATRWHPGGGAVSHTVDTSKRTMGRFVTSLDRNLTRWPL